MNIFAFPFYNKVKKQVRFSACASAASGGLVAPAERWLPFMLTLPKTNEGIDCVNIWNAIDDSIYGFITPEKFEFELYSDGVSDYIFYYGGKVSGMNLPCGQQFYLEIKGFFSEVFQVVNNLNDYIKIEWKHKLPVGPAIYQTGFVNRLYVDAIIAEPIYKLEEEGDQDGYGVFLPTRSRLEKTFKFDIAPLPEFLVDALSAAPLHNSIIIGKHTNCREVKVTPDWDLAGTVGCTAVIKVEFNEDYPLEADYCGNLAAINLVDLSNYIPKTWLCDGSPNPSPNWVEDTAKQSYCEVINNVNTGWILQPQIDINTNSSTYNQTRNFKLKYDTTTCPVPQVFKSASITEFIYKNDCATNGTGTGVPYYLAAGYIVDSTSQIDVDKRAQLYFDSSKQKFANDNGSCIYPGDNNGDDFSSCIFPTGHNECWQGYIKTADGTIRQYKDVSECQQCAQIVQNPANGGTGCLDLACF